MKNIPFLILAIWVLTVTAFAQSSGNYWNYCHVTTAAVCSTTPATIHTVTINKYVASGVIDLYDTQGTIGPIIGVITSPATVSSLAPETLIYDTLAQTGISIGTSGSGTQDITVSYR